MLSFESTQEETSAVLYNTRYPIVLILIFSIYLFTHNFVLSSLVILFCHFVCSSLYPQCFTSSMVAHTCHLCCSAAPSLLHCAPSEWHNFHNLRTHSTSLQQRNAMYNKLFKVSGSMNMFYQAFVNCTIVRCLQNYILNILHMSLSNPEDASVAPLG